MRTDFLRPGVIVAVEKRSAMGSTTIAMGRLMGFPRLAHLFVERGFGPVTRGIGVSAMRLNPSHAWTIATENANPMNPVTSAVPLPMRFAMGWMTTAMALQTKALVANRGRQRPFRVGHVASRR